MTVEKNGGGRSHVLAIVSIGVLLLLNLFRVQLGLDPSATASAVRMETVEREIATVKTEYARKDMVEQQLGRIEDRLQILNVQLDRANELLDQIRRNGK